MINVKRQIKNKQNRQHALHPASRRLHKHQNSDSHLSQSIAGCSRPSAGSSEPVSSSHTAPLESRTVSRHSRVATSFLKIRFQSNLRSVVQSRSGCSVEIVARPRWLPDSTASSAQATT